MRTCTAFLVVAALFAAFTFTTQPSAQADTFGSGSNAFNIDFVNIGNAGNAADTTGYGAVPYEYRIGKYEISENIISNASASGLAHVTAGFWTGEQPASDVTWYEAAAFVNWLNTSTGKQAAYNLAWTGSAWSMSIWSGADAWTLGGTNLYRHRDAYYFLPSDDEWYKAAFYNASGTNYYSYPTQTGAVPIPVQSGTDPDTAVYKIADIAAASTNAGGLSSYGTMAQGGNLLEWIESAYDGTNDSPTEIRAFRGGFFYVDNELFLSSAVRYGETPSTIDWLTGFRVASVPEPSTYALLLMTGAGALWWARRRR